MIVRSDVVISSVRPRAFEQLGLEPAALAEKNPALTWVALTAHGWFGPGRDFVGFGDDAAAAAGLVIWGEDGRPMFAGDAIADPLAGFAATAGALRSLQKGGGMLIDVSLREAAAFVARGPRLHAESCDIVRRESEWCVHSGGRRISVLPPKARPVTAHAAPFGADTQRVLTALTE
jgi:crotonobetainyl-CoA:carnitine CoA-transferase CaiB-like acyl-CoA transferase